MYTSHYEAARSFAETRDGTFPVKTYGDWLPRHLFGGLHILCAILRALWLAIVVAFTEQEYEVFICDQVSAYVPVLRFLRPRTPILFYCHFPDQLLSSRGSALKRLYRRPFDSFERSTTAMAHEIVVNSTFTRGVVQRTFGSALAGRELQVLYPCIDVPPASAPAPSADGSILFVSINRFERKKAVELAVDAFALLQTRLPAALAARTHLVIAGGYDTRVAENVSYHAELVARAKAAGLVDCAIVGSAHPMGGFPGVVSVGTAAPFAQVELFSKVTFVRSFTDAQKAWLLASAATIVYTPSNEHFGIVPIEAGAAGRPVIAVSSGGPLESVVHGRTGFLCAPEPEVRANMCGACRAVSSCNRKQHLLMRSAGHFSPLLFFSRPLFELQEFASAMQEIASKPGAVASMGAAGHAHVTANFSRVEFGRRLEAMCLRLSREAYLATLPAAAAGPKLSTGTEQAAAAAAAADPAPASASSGGSGSGERSPPVSASRRSSSAAAASKKHK